MLTTDLLLLTLTLTNDRRALSSERAHQMDKTVTSDHEPQMGLDTKTDSLTISRNVTLTLH
jgi:hypothetical protein